jgi:predicted nucleic acid-binding protein
MIRVFLDSSVLFSAAYSSRGHSRDLLNLAIQGEIGIVISDLVIEETRRNLAKSAPETEAFLDLILDLLPLEYEKPTKREILKAAEVVALKDAAIVAGAKKADVDLLVSLDKKHLLGNTQIGEILGVEVERPQEAVKIILGNE